MDGFLNGRWRRRICGERAYSAQAQTRGGDERGENGGGQHNQSRQALLAMAVVRKQAGVIPQSRRRVFGRTGDHGAVRIVYPVKAGITLPLNVRDQA